MDWEPEVATPIAVTEHVTAVPWSRESSSRRRQKRASESGTSKREASARRNWLRFPPIHKGARAESQADFLIPDAR